MIVTLVVYGRPPAKNKIKPLTNQGGRPRRYKSKRYREFQSDLDVAWVLKGAPRFNRGTLAVTVTAFWPSKRSSKSLPRAGEPVAHGDIDAPIEAVLDSLQLCGCIDNDSRVTHSVLVKRWDKEHPRIEVTVETIGED